MENYFSKFPKTVYNNVTCLDITRKVKIDDSILRKPNIFYSYEIQNNLRSDQVSEYYYDDPTYDWLIYLQNEIVDPYYGWYLSEDDFSKMIQNKYGSYENAVKRIKYYQLNWADLDLEITKSFYDNNLPYSLRKYYTPNFAVGNTIISYTIRNEDWIANTNKLIQFNINYVSGNSYTSGEVIDIKSNYNNQIANGGGEAISSNSSTIILKNISGDTTNNYYLVGETSNTIAQISSSQILSENITAAEAVYWIPVSYHEYEKSKNEQKKTIRLIDSNYALNAAEQLRKKLLE
jgi:hypothetical protein